MGSVSDDIEAERRQRVDELLSELREQLLSSGNWHYVPPTLGAEATLTLTWHMGKTALAFCPRCWEKAVPAARIAGARSQCRACGQWCVVREERYEATSIVGGRQSVSGLWRMEAEPDLERIKDCSTRHGEGTAAESSKKS